MATLKMETMGCTKKRVGANRSVQIRTVDGQLLRRGCIVLPFGIVIIFRGFVCWAMKMSRRYLVSFCQC